MSAVTGRDRDTPEDRETPAARWIREQLAAWPPLAEWQRDRLRALLDLSGGRDDAG